MEISAGSVAVQQAASRQDINCSSRLGIVEGVPGMVDKVLSLECVRPNCAPSVYVRCKLLWHAWFEEWLLVGYEQCGNRAQKGGLRWKEGNGCVRQRN